MVCLCGSTGHKSRNHNDCPLNLKICKLKASEPNQQNTHQVIVFLSLSFYVHFI